MFEGGGVGGFLVTSNGGRKKNKLFSLDDSNPCKTKGRGSAGKKNDHLSRDSNGGQVTSKGKKF